MTDGEAAAATEAATPDVAAELAAVAPVAVTSSEQTESILCHLEFVCRAVFICAHRSFLHDFDLGEKKNRGYESVNFYSPCTF